MSLQGPKEPAWNVGVRKLDAKSSVFISAMSKKYIVIDAKGTCYYKQIGCELTADIVLWLLNFEEF